MINPDTLGVSATNNVFTSLSTMAQANGFSSFHNMTFTGGGIRADVAGTYEFNLQIGYYLPNNGTSIAWAIRNATANTILPCRARDSNNPKDTYRSITMTYIGAVSANHIFQGGNIQFSGGANIIAVDSFSFTMKRLMTSN
jgi:hypothetical protein